MLTPNPTATAAIFHVLVHAALTAAALARILLIWAVIWPFATRRAEIIMRSAAAVCGLLIYLGAKTLGLSIPQFMLSALTQATSYTTGIVGEQLRPQGPPPAAAAHMHRIDTVYAQR